jgi:alpha-L-arabinofuranosidase
MEIALETAGTIGKTANIEVLTGGLNDVNSIEEPKKVAPKAFGIQASARFTHEFPARSVTVMRLTTR